MPIYEYECQKCKEQFELLQGFDASTVAKCPQCGGKAQRLISPPSILFKGSGFHVTDYARSGEKKSPPSDSGSSKEKKQSESSSTPKETKSDTTSKEKSPKSNSKKEEPT